MTTSLSKSKSTGGFTLIEILLAVGLCAILAATSVPTMVGWMAEHRLRMQADELIKLVQEAKLQAEKTAQAQVVVLLPAGSMPSETTRANVHYFNESKGTTWSLRRYGQTGRDDSPTFIEIDRSGWVSPVSFRVSSGEKYVEYRLDFLTGHAQETSFSF